MLNDAMGVRLVLSQKLVAHLRGEDLPEDDPVRLHKQKEDRDRDYRAIVETIQNPDEVWLVPFGLKGNRLRQRYLKSFAEGDQILVIERDASGHVAVTSFNPPRRTLENQRKGYPVYRRED